MMVCTFAGHREVFGLGQSRVVEILERLLEAEQEMTCYVGGKGEFDALCASAVRTLKHRHPDKAISLVLVLPYMEQRLNTDKEYYESSFDEILIPIELADIHYKQAITACNLHPMHWRSYLCFPTKRFFCQVLRRSCKCDEVRLDQLTFPVKCPFLIVFFVQLDRILIIFRISS